MALTNFSAKSEPSRTLGRKNAKISKAFFQKLIESGNTEKSLSKDDDGE